MEIMSLVRPFYGFIAYELCNNRGDLVPLATSIIVLYCIVYDISCIFACILWYPKIPETIMNRIHNSWFLAIYDNYYVPMVYKLWFPYFLLQIRASCDNFDTHSYIYLALKIILYTFTDDFCYWVVTHPITARYFW